MLSDPAPRPPRCYDPTTPPHRDEQGVHVYDHATIRGLLRDPHRVTSDVSELLTPEQRDRLHPVSSFVWATDRKTLSGCPGRHAALRSAMAPWFAVETATRRAAAAEEIASGFVAGCAAGDAFDAYHDYTLPVAVAYLADWLGIMPSDVMYAVDDQLAVGDMFASWPPLATPEMDDYYRAVMARPGLTGVAAQARAWSRPGCWPSASRGACCTRSPSARWRRRRRPRWPSGSASSTTGGTGWPTRTGPGRRWRRRCGSGRPFPQATRTAREEFTVGDVAVQPGDQVLMWLTAANRDLPGRAARRRWTGSIRIATPPSTWAGDRATTAAAACTTPGPRPSPR